MTRTDTITPQTAATPNGWDALQHIGADADGDLFAAYPADATDMDHEVYGVMGRPGAWYVSAASDGHVEDTATRYETLDDAIEAAIEATEHAAPNAATLDSLTAEARALGVFVYCDEDGIQIRPDSGDDSSGDVTIYLDEDGNLTASEAGNEWAWTGTLTEYLRERAATNNWT